MNNGAIELWALAHPAFPHAADLVVEDSVVRAHQSATGTFAMRVEPVGGATEPVTAVLRNTVFEDNFRGGGLFVGEHTVAEVDGVLLRNHGSSDLNRDGSWGHAIAVSDGATLQMTRSTVLATNATVARGAVTAFQAGPVTLEDVLIMENKARGVLALGSEAPVSIRRARMTGNLGGDVLLQDAVAVVEDARLGDNPFHASSAGVSVRAVQVASADGETTHLELRRALVAGARHGGVGAAGMGTSVLLEDVAVVETEAFEGGWGIVGAFAPNVTPRRVFLARNHLAAIELANGGGVLGLEDVVIRDTQPFPGEGVGGYGVVLHRGSSATMARTRIEGSHELGVLAAGSRLQLEDVVVERTRVAACARRPWCIEYGHAVGVYASSTLDATRFVFADAATCGVHFALDAQVDLTDGHVTRTRIGACVQVDGYDVSRLSNNVFYTDNERNLDATELPVPDPGG